jgi:hypothetical protein
MKRLACYLPERLGGVPFDLPKRLGGVPSCLPRRLGSVLCWVIVAAGLAVAGAAAEEAFSVAGRVSATDQEAQEGYFAIDQQTMIVVKPNSPMHAYLKTKIGQRIRITVEPAAGSE